MDAKAADELLAKIDEIAEIFWETKKALSRTSRRSRLRGGVGPFALVPDPVR